MTQENTRKEGSRTLLVRGRKVLNDEQIQISLSGSCNESDLMSFLDYSEIDFVVTFVDETGFYCYIDHPPGFEVSVVPLIPLLKIKAESSDLCFVSLARNNKDNVVLYKDKHLSIEQLNALRSSPITISRSNDNRFTFGAAKCWSIARGEAMTTPPVVVDPFFIPEGLRKLMSLGQLSIKDMDPAERSVAHERIKNAINAVKAYKRQKLPRSVRNELDDALHLLNDKLTQTKVVERQPGINSDVVLSYLSDKLPSDVLEIVRSHLNTKSTKVSLESFDCHRLITDLLKQSDRLKQVALFSCSSCGNEGKLKSIREGDRSSKRKRWQVECNGCGKCTFDGKFVSPAHDALIQWNMQNYDQQTSKLPDVLTFQSHCDDARVNELETYIQYLDVLASRVGELQVEIEQGNIRMLRNWIRFYITIFSHERIQY